MRTIVTTSVLLAATTAHANEKLFDAGKALGKYYEVIKLAKSRTTGVAVERTPDECVADIAAWKAKGIKDGDVIRSQAFDEHPSVQPRVQAVPGIKLSEMPAICDEYKKLYPKLRIPHALSLAEARLLWIDGSPTDDASITPEQLARIEKEGDPAACKKNVAEARAIDPAMKVGSNPRTLDEFDAKVCDELAKQQPKWLADARAAYKTRREKALAPYIAAGIGGKKLDLMIEYDGVYWRLPGGAKSDDPKKLAAAKVLFHWLEAKDPDPRYVVHTIRKYQFKGNDLVKVSEKKYRRLTGASVGNVFK